MQQSGNAWTEKWLGSVLDGASTMSQRKLSSVARQGGGVEEVAKVAREKGVHLLPLEDDEGEPIVVASVKPFRTIC